MLLRQSQGLTTQNLRAASLLFSKATLMARSAEDALPAPSLSMSAGTAAKRVTGQTIARAAAVVVTEVIEVAETEMTVAEATRVTEEADLLPADHSREEAEADPEKMAAPKNSAKAGALFATKRATSRGIALSLEETQEEADALWIAALAETTTEVVTDSTTEGLHLAADPPEASTTVAVVAMTWVENA